MKNFNLFLAVFWLMLGVAVIVHDALNPGKRVLSIRWTDLSIGWLGIVLAAYNLARWYSTRSYERQRALEEERARRERERPRQPPGQEPDPNFIFTDPPPSPPEGR